MDPQEFDDALRDLETRVDRLRALYENWFRGYEKTEPMVARKDVERRVYGLRKLLPRNTALRFRYHQLYQRYTTLSTYWQRTSRQIEDGTYRLQLQRMRRRQEAPNPRRERGPREPGDSERPTNPPTTHELDLEQSLDVSDLLDDRELDEVARALETPGPHSEPPPPPAAKPASKTFARPRRGTSAPPGALRPRLESRGTTPPPAPSGEPVAPARPLSPPAAPAEAGRASLRDTNPAPPRQARPVPVQSGATLVGRPAPRSPQEVTARGPSDTRLRNLYREYLSARRKNNEPDIRFETVAGSIQRMVPELAKKHGGKNVDFEVVLRNGRVGLKPKVS